MKNSIAAHLTKIIPLCFGFSLLLTGCESFNSFMGGNSSGTGYDSGHSAADKRAYQSTQSSSDKSVKKSTSGQASSESGAATNTVSTPVGVEKKTTVGTVNTPAVPSAAPMVGQ